MEEGGFLTAEKLQNLVFLLVTCFHLTMITGQIISSRSGRKDNTTSMKYPPSDFPEPLSQLGYYTLDQNKIRNKTTPSPRTKDELALHPKCAIISIVEMGGGVVLAFHLN